MQGNYLTIEKIQAYNTAFDLSNGIWDIVIKWDNFEKWSVGQQLVKSADSMSANIAEGFGRYHKKDKIKFYRYSFGSMEETLDWIKKCVYRKLIIEEEKVYILKELEKLPREINHLIKYTDEKLKY